MEARSTQRCRQRAVQSTADAGLAGRQSRLAERLQRMETERSAQELRSVQGYSAGGVHLSGQQQNPSIQR